MLNKLAPKPEDEPEAKPAPSTGTTPHLKRLSAPMPPGDEHTL
jgi:hypothetical protein